MTTNTFELLALNDGRKSFYGKARVTQSENRVTLTSYSTEVVTVDLTSQKVDLLPEWGSSATTLRHVKEFLTQYGFPVGSKRELAAKCGGSNES